MEEGHNTINLAYVETRKVSLLFKIIAFFLVLVFVFNPMYDVLTQFAPAAVGWDCLPTHIQR